MTEIKITNTKDGFQSSVEVLGEEFDRFSEKKSVIVKVTEEPVCHYCGKLIKKEDWYHMKITGRKIIELSHTECYKKFLENKK